MKAFIKLFQVLFCASLLPLLTMCTEHTPELSDVVIFVEPRESVKVEMNSGDKYKYEVSLSTIHDYVSSLKITSFDPINGQKVCLDKTFDKKKVEYAFIYEAPQTDRENLTVDLRFTVADNLGNKAEIGRTVYVVSRMVAIPEKTGIVLYQSGTNRPDALSFDDVSRPFCLTASPNPELADLFMSTGEGSATAAWNSNTKAKFVRNNSFNYVEATAKSINQVFQNSVPTDFVDDIRLNDIIIVGHKTEADGVFLVVNAQRNPDGSVLSIQMNYKGIQRSADNDDVKEDEDGPES